MPVGVGTFGRRRKQARMPISPHDKSTIVSAAPFEINQRNDTIFPGQFYIPATKENDFELLVVGPSSSFRDIDPNRPLVEIPNPSYTVAQSVIKDYCNGLHGCNMKDMMPAVFVVPGAFDKTTILMYKEIETARTFPEMLKDALAKQNNWYGELVKQADSLWARTNRNPIAITHDMKIAATKLSLNREWLHEFRLTEFKSCPACGQQVDPSYPVCRHCKVIINPEKAKELNLQFAS